MQTPLRAVTYGRVSTEDQAEYGTGLDTQDIETVRFADRMGFVVVGRENDPGVSGILYPRTGLERALALLESGQANALIVHRVDRLGRKAYIPQIVFERVKAARCQLFTVEDGEVTDDNIIMFSLRCGMAQSDYSRLVSNMKAGKRRMAESGRVPSRSWSPYGYHIVQKVEDGQVQASAGTYVIVEAEAAVVRTIFERYEAGDTLNNLCHYLHDQGISIPRPERKQVTRSTWQATMIARILSNTAYKGYLMWGKTTASFVNKADLSFDERLNSRTQNPRKRIDTPTPEALQVRIPIPAIVPPALWEACQRKRQENKAGGGIRNDRKHIFASLVFCPNCGRRMNSAHGNNHNRPKELRPILYRCKDHAPSQNASNYVCNRKTYKETDIHASVRRFFMALAETPEFVAAAFTAFQQSHHTDYSAEEHTGIINALREVEARETSTAQAYAKSIRLGTRPEVFEALLTEIAQERKRLLTRKTALEALLIERKEEDPQEIADIVSSYARDILEVLDSETLESVEKNRALRRVLKSIRPEPEEAFRIESQPIQVDIHEAPVTSIVMYVTGTSAKIEIVNTGAERQAA